MSPHDSADGVSLWQWRRRARLQRALVSLAEGQPVAEVADRVGYESASGVPDNVL